MKMNRIHFLNVLEGDCNIIEHTSGRTTVIDVSNAKMIGGSNILQPREYVEARRLMSERTGVPYNKRDFHQKRDPDNPIAYLNNLKVREIFRFIVTHPDMDHLDGIKNLFESFSVLNIWDTNNIKEISDRANSSGYSMDDWKFYKNLRDKVHTPCNRLVLHAGYQNHYFYEDNIQLLSPTPDIVKECNEKENWNGMSYVLLYTPPKSYGKEWKILFAGDSDNMAWDYILKYHTDKVSDIDILFAPHHGRDSDMCFDFLDTLKPKVTLLGNASSKHLAYERYKKHSQIITNNQAGYVVMDIKNDRINFYVKNKEYADYFRESHNAYRSPYDNELKGYYLFSL